MPSVTVVRFAAAGSTPASVPATINPTITTPSRFIRPLVVFTSLVKQ
jgi:hypothetical protein